MSSRLFLQLIENEAQLQAEIDERERLKQELAERLSTVDTSLRQKEKELDKVQSTCADLESQVLSVNADNDQLKVSVCCNLCCTSLSIYRKS